MSRSAYSAQPSAWPEQPASVRWKRVQRSGEVAHLRDLQVMAGNALVVADRHLPPEREARLAERRVPGPARPAEVLRRARVVHRRRAARRRDHRLHPADRLRDVEVHAVQLDDGRIEEVLEPFTELVDTVDHTCRVALEVLDHGVDGLTGQDPLRDGAHRVLDAVQLRPTPLVRLGQVEVDPVEHRGPPRVALRADGVSRAGVRQVLLDEVPARPPRTPRSRARRVSSSTRVQGRVVEPARLELVGQREEERAAGTRARRPTRRPGARTRPPGARRRPTRGGCLR